MPKSGERSKWAEPALHQDQSSASASLGSEHPQGRLQAPHPPKGASLRASGRRSRRRQPWQRSPASDPASVSRAGEAARLPTRPPACATQPFLSAPPHAISPSPAWQKGQERAWLGVTVHGPRPRPSLASVQLVCLPPLDPLVAAARNKQHQALALLRFRFRLCHLPAFPHSPSPLHTHLQAHHRAQDWHHRASQYFSVRFPTQSPIMRLFT